MIVREALKRMPEAAVKMIGENNKIQGLEEGKEPEMAQVFDAAEANAKETVTSE
jgi:hypothetical protein